MLVKNTTNTANCILLEMELHMLMIDILKDLERKELNCLFKTKHIEKRKISNKCEFNTQYYDVVPLTDIPLHVVFIIKDSAGRHLQSPGHYGKISSQSFVQLAARTPLSC